MKAKLKLIHGLKREFDVFEKFSDHSIDTYNIIKKVNNIFSYLNF